MAEVALPGRAWNQLPGAVQVSLSVSGDNATREGRLSVGEGARIELQPQARLSLSSSQQLDVNGTLVSHGGSISLSTQATDPSRPAWRSPASCCRPPPPTAWSRARCWPVAASR